MKWIPPGTRITGSSSGATTIESRARARALVRPLDSLIRVPGRNGVSLCPPLLRRRNEEQGGRLRREREEERYNVSEPAARLAISNIDARACISMSFGESARPWRVK